NYRSTGAILEVANAVAREIPAALELAPADDDRSGTRPDLTAFHDDEAEAAGVARAIADDIAAGVAPEQIAVLYRLRSQSEPIERALQERGIPAVLHGQRRFFDQPMLRAAV